MGNHAYELESVAISLTCKFYLGTVETSSALGELFWFNVQCIPVVHDICAQKNWTKINSNDPSCFALLFVTSVII